MTITKEAFLRTTELSNRDLHGDLAVCIAGASKSAVIKELRKLFHCRTSIKCKISIIWPKSFFLHTNADFNPVIIKEEPVKLNEQVYRAVFVTDCDMNLIKNDDLLLATPTSNESTNDDSLNVGSATTNH